MNLQNRMNLLQRTMIALSATGTAALMAVPAFSQAVPTQGVVNNGDVNRVENQNQLNNSTPSASDACAPYTSGGIGGPIDSQASSSTQTAPSSYDTARTGVGNGSSTLNSDLSVSSSNSQTSVSTQTAPSSYDTARTGVDRPANSNVSQSSNSMMMGSTNSTMVGSTTYNNSGMQRAMVSRQFDANNPSAAVAFRLNGPAGTAGHEAQMNLDAYQQGRVLPLSALNNTSNMTTTQASTTRLPIACAPR